MAQEAASLTREAKLHSCVEELTRDNKLIKDSNMQLMIQKAKLTVETERLATGWS